MLDWDHNAYYQRLLLRQLPRRRQRVLDVGCGAGSFAVQLAQRSKQVDAVDRSAEMIAEAKRRAPGNVDCVLGDVLAGALPGRDYDAIVSITALHHMPLEEALPRLADALVPGGVLAPSRFLARTSVVNCGLKSSPLPDTASWARCSG